MVLTSFFQILGGTQRLINISSVLIKLLLLTLSTTVYAGNINSISVSSTSNVAADASEYTFTFTPQTTVSSAAGNRDDGIYFVFDLDNDYTVSGATLESISPNTGMAITSTTDSTGRILMYNSASNGVIQGGQSYTVVISGIVNPATTQTPDDHAISTSGGSGSIDSGSVAAAAIVAGATNPPAVSNQIADLNNLEESAGLTQYIANLNNHFVDLDNDTITYSAVSSDTSVVEVVLSGTNNRTLSLRAKKFGDATVTVTATSVDGSISDTFDVSTIGAMTVNSVTTSSDVAGASATLTFSLTLESQIDRSSGDGAYIVFDLPDSYLVDSNSVIQSITPMPPGSFNSGQTAGSSQIRLINNTSFGPGTYTVVVGPVTNPGTAGAPGNILISTVDGASTTFDKGSIAAPVIGAAGTPTVTTPISDRLGLREALGTLVHVSDLNTNFDDSDDDTLTFTASSDDSSVVSVTTSGTDGRILSLQANKFGSAEITVRATSIDGFIEDSFSVTTIGELSINSVVPSNDFASQESDYTINVTLEADVVRDSGDGAYIIFDFPNEFGIDDDTVIKSITPDPGGVASVSRNAGNASIAYLNTGTNIAAGTYTIEVGPVTNPSESGLAGDLVVSTVDGASTTFDDGSLALPEIQSNEPTVSNELADQLGIKKVDGAVQVSADLNGNFEDLDGDTITFTVESSDTTVVTAVTSGTDGRILTITPQGFGSASVTVTATTSDGTVTDEFDVTVLGALTIDSFASTTDNISDDTTHTITISIETPVVRAGGDGATIFFDYPDAFGVSASTVISPTSGALSEGVWDTGFDADSATIYYRNTGADIAAGSYSFRIQQLENPGAIGAYGNLSIGTSNGSPVAPSSATMFDMGRVATPEIVDNKVSVVLPIDDLADLKVSAGATQYVADLNDHFSDSVGGTLSFTAQSSDASVVSVATSGSNGETLTLNAHKHGTATVTVSATSPNGARNDEFLVSTIDTLLINSIESSDALTFHKTDISLDLTLASDVTLNGEEAASIVFDFPDSFGIDFSTTVKSITPDPTSGLSVGIDGETATIRFNSDSATIPAGNYQIVLGPVSNPSDDGLPGDLLISTQSGSTMVDMGLIALPGITASNAPQLDQALPDQTDVKESAGTVQIVADLNAYFSDADSDTLMFTAVSSDDSVVIVTTSGDNGEILSIAAQKFGEATVTVTATAIDGSITDDFDVTTIGQIDFSSIASSSDKADEGANIALEFTLEESVLSDGGDGAYLIFSFPAAYSLTAQTAINTASPELVGQVTIDAANSTVKLLADAVSIPAGAYALSIDNVINPGETGTFGALTLMTGNGAGTTYDEGSIEMPQINVGPSNFIVIPISDGKAVIVPL